MSRRRYLSTDISRDKRVAQLAERAGPIAALLYTWAIPHAADNATIVSDPEEFLTEVAPNMVMRGLVSLDDAERCIDVALELGLFAARENGLLLFPDSFYKHQTYISGARRGTPPPDAPAPEPAHNTADQRETPQNGADERAAAQNATSFKSSSSFPVRDETLSLRSSGTPPLAAGAAAVKPKRGPPGNPRVAAVIDAFRALGPPEPLMTDRDRAAIKRSNVPPGLIAECYDAVRRGDWGDKWKRDNLSVRAAVDWANAYREQREDPTEPELETIATPPNGPDETRCVQCGVGGSGACFGTAWTAPARPTCGWCSASWTDSAMPWNAAAQQRT